jgi:hypothetical protein
MGAARPWNVLCFPLLLMSRALVCGAFSVLLFCATASPAMAEDGATSRAHWQATFESSDNLQTPAAMQAGASAATQAPAPAQPRVIEYSDAYRLRGRIHKDASVALLPLFGAEGLLGESLYNTPTDTKKTAHIVVGTAILGLFALNSVTGVWNLVESRHDPNGRTRRWVHGLLMMGADVGFIATLASGPGGRGRFTSTFDSRKSTHRTLAFTSIGMATGGYLVMLIGPH